MYGWNIVHKIVKETNIWDEEKTILHLAPKKDVFIWITTNLFCLMHDAFFIFYFLFFIFLFFIVKGLP